MANLSCRCIRRWRTQPIERTRPQPYGLLRSGALLLLTALLAPQLSGDALPLEPERNLSFTTREGSWMSVDVSPDGRHLVVDHLGDLFTIPMTGGKAERLTAGMEFDAQPRFSPDGTRIVFVSDRSGSDNLWILTLATRELSQLTRRETDRFVSPIWMPDGRSIIVTLEKGLPGTPPGKLHLYPLTGGEGQPLIDGPADLRTLGPALAADSRIIWFSQVRNMRHWLDNAPLGISTWQLASYDLESGRMTVQTARHGGGLRPTLSPDGRWLVYGTRHVGETALRLRDLDTGDERWLAHPVQRDEQESRAMLDLLPAMAFTPDSKEVVVPYGGKLWRVPIDGRAPTEVPFEIDVDLPLGPRAIFRYPIEDSASFPARQIRDAVPSPDGKRLAFTALGRLYTMEYPGGTPRQVAVGDSTEPFDPAWSPDGRWIAYASWASTGEGHLHKVRESGSTKPVRLTTVPGLYRQPAWTPDGKRIVAIRSPTRAFLTSVEEGATRLLWIQAEGSASERAAATEIAMLAHGEQRPHFGRDPQRILLHNGRTGSLFSMDFGGKDRREHIGRVTGLTLPNEPEPIAASLVKMSPTGEQVLAQVRHHLYVISLPAESGSVERISVTDPAAGSLTVRKLTELGGEFPAWSADGKRVHWSLADAHFVSEGSPGRVTEFRVSIPVRRDQPNGAVMFRGARIITMRADEAIENGDLLVRDNRIEAVGPHGTLTVPAGVKVFDVRGATIVPGFVDLHAHPDRGWTPMRLQPAPHAAALAYGITTAREPYPPSTAVFTQSDLIAAGELLGPRLYTTGPAILREEHIESAAHARNLLRRYSEYYRTGTIKMYEAGERRQRQWIVAAARELGLMPTTEGWIDTPMSLSMVIDGYSGQEHANTGYPFYEDVIRLYADSKVTYTPTAMIPFGGGPSALEPLHATENVLHDRKLRRFTHYGEIEEVGLRRTGSRDGGWFHPDVRVTEKTGKFFADVAKAGGHLGVGSHGELEGLGYHWELWTMQGGGLPTHDALRAATLSGARALGLDADLGSLEPGKLADLVILEKNPLTNIRNSNTIRHVMKNGRLYAGDTLDQVWPDEREAGPFPWEAAGAEPSVTAGIRQTAMEESTR
jgi:imidazolonepropionase-like amidohydrolase/Tol biopolymer transport system component